MDTPPGFVAGRRRRAKQVATSGPALSAGGADPRSLLRRRERRTRASRVHSAATAEGSAMGGELQYRAGVLDGYPDVYTPEARAALAALAPLEPERRAVMAARSARRLARAREGRRIEFLDADATIP